MLRLGLAVVCIIVGLLTHAVARPPLVTIEDQLPLLYDWDFRNISALPSNFTFTRASGTENDFTCSSSGTLMVAYSAGVPDLPACDPGTSSVLGMGIFGGTTNLLLQDRNWSNASWTASNVTATQTAATGVDGTAASATFLTATAGNATVLQSITHASANICGSYYIKRVTGTGEIDITIDGGTTWTAITAPLSTAWTRASRCQTSLTNPNFGIRIVTNADEVEVDGGQVEISPFPTPVVFTTTTSQTRTNSDMLKISTPILPAAWTFAAEYWLPFIDSPVAGQFPSFLCYSDNTTNNIEQTFYGGSSVVSGISTKVTASNSSIGQVSPTGNGGALVYTTAVASYDGVKLFLGAQNGKSSAIAAGTGAYPTGLNVLYFGQCGSGTSTPMYGYLSRIKVWAGYLKNWQITDIQRKLGFNQ